MTLAENILRNIRLLRRKNTIHTWNRAKQMKAEWKLQPSLTALEFTESTEKPRVQFKSPPLKRILLEMDAEKGKSTTNFDGTGDHSLVSDKILSKEFVEEPQVSEETFQKDEIDDVEGNGVKCESQKNLLSELAFADCSLVEENDIKIDPSSKSKKAAKKEKKKKKTEKKKMDGSGKVTKPTVNYFVAVRVSNPEIHAKLENVQKGIVEANKDLKHVLTKICKLHLTLCVLHLEEEQLDKASSLMEACQVELKENFKGERIELSFKGLGHFKNKVLFAKVEEDDAWKRLKLIVDVVKKHFDKEGMLVDDNDFTAHLTVAKLSQLSKVPKLRKKINSIPLNSYSDHVDDYFGNQAVDSIQLLAMFKPADSDGYYHNLKEVNFIE